MATGPTPTFESIRQAWQHKQFDYDNERVTLSFGDAQWIDTCLEQAVAPPSGETPDPPDPPRGLINANRGEMFAWLQGWRSGWQTARSSTAPQTGGWIAAAERLPENGGDLVLVVIDRSPEQPLRDIAWYDGEEWHARSHLSAVTHWQPLDTAPAPPPVTAEGITTKVAQGGVPTDVAAEKSSPNPEPGEGTKWESGRRAEPLACCQGTAEAAPSVDDFFGKWLKAPNGTAMRQSGGQWTDASVKGFAEAYAAAVSAPLQKALVQAAGAMRSVYYGCPEMELPGSSGRTFFENLTLVEAALAGLRGREEKER